MIFFILNILKADINKEKLVILLEFQLSVGIFFSFNYSYSITNKVFFIYQHVLYEDILLSIQFTQINHVVFSAK